jgi:hypothetical protein
MGMLTFNADFALSITETATHEIGLAVSKRF